MTTAELPLITKITMADHTSIIKMTTGELFSIPISAITLLNFDEDSALKLIKM